MTRTQAPRRGIGALTALVMVLPLAASPAAETATLPAATGVSVAEDVEPAAHGAGESDLCDQIAGDVPDDVCASLSESVLPPFADGAAAGSPGTPGASIQHSGISAASAPSADTSQLWYQFSKASGELAPEPRTYASAAYDAGNGQVVLFGGSTGRTDFGDTWTWDGARWTAHSPAVAPQARANASMTYHEGSGDVVLFGGHTKDGEGKTVRLSDTWLWDGMEWTEVEVPVGPSARTGASMAYDRSRGNVVLFGGSSLGDTWLFDGTTWTEATPAVSPEPLSGAGMAYAPQNEGILLYGGNYGSPNETWLWDGQDWTLLTPETTPGSTFFNVPMTFDAHRGQVTMFLYPHPYGDHGEAWSWDGADWRQHEGYAPPKRGAPVFVYDGANNNVMLYGGGNQGVFDDQWSWDGDTWSPSTSAAAAFAPRLYGSAVYDGGRNQTVAFGGVGYNNRTTAETMVLRGGTWEMILPDAEHPEARLWAAMAYDPERREVVLFGGNGDARPYLADTWVFDGVTWHEKAPPVSPPARVGAVMAYDSASQRIVLFGGQQQTANADEPLGDTWTWDGTSWNEEDPDLSPSARSYAAMASDSQGRPTMFGGMPYAGRSADETWRWNSGEGTWEELTAAANANGGSPPARYGGAMAKDGVSGLLVLFGGTDRELLDPNYPGAAGGTFQFDDTWLFDGSAWRPAEPDVRPEHRWFPAMADGAPGHPPVVIGGGGGGEERTGFRHCSGLAMPCRDVWSWGQPASAQLLRSTITALAGRPSDDGTTVTGRLESSDVLLATASEARRDGEPGAHNTGGEILAASLTHRQSRANWHRPEDSWWREGDARDIVLRLSLTMLPARPVSEVSLHGLQFTVDGIGHELRAMRSRAPAEGAAWFTLHRCDPDCVETAQLEGVYNRWKGSFAVQVSVPVEALGADDGTTLTDMRAFSARGETATGALVEMDELAIPDTTVESWQVSLGVAPADAPADRVPFDTLATVHEDGTFTGTVDRPLQAGQRLWARACARGVCHTASTLAR